jgi:hypothetical protein
MDGEIDFSGYTLRELLEAESHILRDRYPKNYANLKQEIERRVADDEVPDLNGSPEPEERVWEKPDNSGTQAELSTGKLVKYIIVFVVAAFVLNIITDSSLEAFGYSFVFLPRIFTYSVAAMVVGWMFVSTHRRLFYRSEAQEMIFGSMAGVILLDLTKSAIVMINSEEVPSISIGVGITLAIGLILVYLFEMLLVFVAYRFPTRLMMLHMRKSSGQAEAN